MNKPIRVIVYGVGAMGSIITRLLLEKSVDIVGAIGRSPNKVGRDLGDVAGIGRKLDVIVEDNAEKVLSR
ncbi:MAG: dihydrodipicolinate reductase, partial [Desulfobulbia bacterium]